MKVRTLAILLAAALASQTLHARADAPVFGWTYDHAAITHRGDSDLDPLVSAALGEWGRYSAVTDAGPGRDIVIRWGDTHGAAAYAAPFGAYNGTMAAQNVRPDAPLCEIVVAPWLNDGTAGRPEVAAVVAHEVGHCLGLDHAVYRDPLTGRHAGHPECIMYPAQATTFCADELMTIARLYPRRLFTVTIGGITSD